MELKNNGSDMDIGLALRSGMILQKTARFIAVTASLGESRQKCRRFNV